MPEPEPLYAAPGDIIIAEKTGIIMSTPLGSCVAVIAYDWKTRIGGMAHIMLPGHSKKDRKDKYRYAEQGIPKLIKDILKKGSRIDNLRICLVGGANVLKKPDETLVFDIIDSVQKVIYEMGIPVIKSSLGGYERRSATLDMNSGKVFYTIGNNPKEILCQII